MSGRGVCAREEIGAPSMLVVMLFIIAEKAKASREEVKRCQCYCLISAGFFCFFPAE